MNRTMDLPVLGTVTATREADNITYFWKPREPDLTSVNEYLLRKEIERLERENERLKEQLKELKSK